MQSALQWIARAGEAYPRLVAPFVDRVAHWRPHSGTGVRLSDDTPHRLDAHDRSR